jgi:hypothetical protein
MAYPNDGTPAVHIKLAKVKWVEAEWAGVEFLSVSPQNHELHRLYGDQVNIGISAKSISTVTR